MCKCLVTVYLPLTNLDNYLVKTFSFSCSFSRVVMTFCQSDGVFCKIC